MSDLSDDRLADERVASMRLKHAPLVEALLEIRWKLQRSTGELSIDPYYRVILGRLSDKASARYPEYERLPSASIPEEMAGYLVQHRFRHGPDDYPLIQLGPGIFTLNETVKYDPKDFQTRAVEAISLLYQVHPDPNSLEIESLQLRYINADEFDYETNNLFDYLRDKMKVSVSLPAPLFKDFGIQSSPRGMSWQSVFKSSSPSGDVISRFATGEHEGKKALIWETMVNSSGGETPQMPEGFNQWFEQAHHITDGWFWRLIAGDLERKYRGE